MQGQDRQHSSSVAPDSAMNSVSDVGMDRSSAVGSDAASYSIPFPANVPHTTSAAGAAVASEESGADGQQ